jgi:lauroyl/myristoyl acyltransferase
VIETLKFDDWGGSDDPVVEVTRRYLAALERLIRSDPAQYAWTNARWGAAFARAGMARRLGESEGAG